MKFWIWKELNQLYDINTKVFGQEIYDNKYLVIKLQVTK